MAHAILQSFDNVIVLYEGRQIYFGPTSSAAEYFINLGFDKPSQATTADFLTSITTPSEHRARQGYESRVPRSPNDFADAWNRSQERKHLAESIEDLNRKHPLRNRSSQGMMTGYRVSPYYQIQACVHRAYRRFFNNSMPIISNIIGNAIMAIVMGSAFYNLSETTSSFQSRSILLFYSIMINSCLPAFEVRDMAVPAI